MAVLVGFYKESDAEGPAQLAGTAEISFDARGANAVPPTPHAPPDCPYICNMAVRKSLRRYQLSALPCSTGLFMVGTNLSITFQEEDWMASSGGMRGADNENEG